MRSTLLRLGMLLCAVAFVMTTLLQADIVSKEQDKDLLEAPYSLAYKRQFFRV